jgi:hypothetical protein
MKKTIIFLMVLLGLASAISFNVYSEKGLYNPGSNIVVYADISNDGDNVLSGVIYSTLVSDGKSDEAIVSHEAYLAPNESKKIAIYDFKLTDDYPPGEYTVTATMVSNKTAVGYAQDTFMINGTLADMDSWLLSCTDSTCSNQSSMFLVGQSAYLGFNSTTDDVTCTAEISTPSGIKTTVGLPTSITLQEKGTYSVSGSCKKSGYHDATPSLMLGALSSWPTVKTIQNCNENNVCDNNENHSICPQDCPEPEPTAFPIEYIVGAVALIIAALLAWKLLMGKKQ